MQETRPVQMAVLWTGQNFAFSYSQKDPICISSLPLYYFMCLRELFNDRGVSVASLTNEGTVFILLLLCHVHTLTRTVSRAS